MDPLQDQEKWDFAIIYYTLARSEVSKKTHFWVPFWDRLGDKIVENRVPEQHQKKVLKIDTHFTRFFCSFWGQFLSKKSVVCRSKMSLTCGPLKIVILAPSGHPKSIKFEVIFWCKFDRFGRWLGRAVHKHQCSFSSVVHVILAAVQSTAEQSRAQY